MTRHLVLFAREPSRQAREKGFGRVPDASLLFSKFAAGWSRAAEAAGASLLISTPAEDLSGWRRTPGISATWIVQEGRNFGERLRETAVRAASLPGHAVVVGGDVVPCPDRLAGAFESLEKGAEAVLVPASDGGFSLIAIRVQDADLLAGIGQRRRNAFSVLRDALLARGRRVAVLPAAPDLDGRTGLRALLRDGWFGRELSRLGRRLLSFRAYLLVASVCPSFECPATVLPVLRGPPLAA
ncbi:MAG TPA: DUF2064 domain-containing protein [Thermoanaerobaculia bacterium]|nr:DUF2064 domain-containing protein [Thermoanaerobaculia bacterium]